MQKLHNCNTRWRKIIVKKTASPATSQWNGKVHVLCSNVAKLNILDNVLTTPCFALFVNPYLQSHNNETFNIKDAYFIQSKHTYVTILYKCMLLESNQLTM